MTSNILNTPTYSTPWPVPTLVSHPRIFASANRLERLRARWTDSAWASVVNIYKGKTEAFCVALNYLADGTKTHLNAAVTAELARPYNVFGPTDTQLWA